MSSANPNPQPTLDRGTSATAEPYDALLVCSFGGPNGPDDVLPFLRNVVRGKNIPDERLAEVGEHYFHFGGKSPINEQNLALVDALSTELRSRGSQLPVLWGNRNWHPYTVDVLRDAYAFGARRILTLVTSAYASYSGSRQYREHLAEAVAALGVEDLTVDVLRPFFNDVGFVRANTDAVLAAIRQLQSTAAPEGRALESVHVAYVTHSIPQTMQDASAATGPGYAEQHEDVRAVIDEALARELDVTITSSLSYCSRSGDPRTPWLEPDISDRLTELAEAGHTHVVIAPIGFLSDHMEVAFDLDVEASETAEELGLKVQRAATAGTAPVFVASLADLVLERAARERGESAEPRTVGALDAFPDHAPAGSCRMRLGEVSGVPVIAGSAD